ncbi:oxygen-independent coproporphyrinogen III oxidase, putative [Candidatus Syntrophocurvum alkaliphilum]|uniref:Oxygen-independent coproporphyrinogen III oxidase, putative n=1 Tax=Candidatus Syntrophocurvum alkaliphilum TaxID=2293317 RepID=A0A6I6D6G4_9FIRM|nr:radical SAM protein [Candidatus Syntrophocurvum alkaliphilum]QGT98866.1 oxygen-independent coproporphyrinogen III oxidase, putative [Candidatus Syntrophocurvum alkaliphilum]
MRYEGTVYRPPSEANSLLIQATIGCPHNKCTFCPLYKGTQFKLRSVEDIKEDLATAKNYYGDFIDSIFLPDGNTIIMKTDQLVEIFEYAHSLFPNLKRITVYGSARYVNKKKDADIKRLKQAGLTRLHMGMESGDDIVLERIQKGTTAKELIEAGIKLRQADIDVSEYYLVGIGGLERTKEHAINSAKVLNAIKPDFIRLRTFVPALGTPLYDDYKVGKFELLSPHTALREIRLLVENLTCENATVLSDHVSNYWNVKGIIPQDKEAMLNHIDKAFDIDESRFRQIDASRL